MGDERDFASVLFAETKDLDDANAIASVIMNRAKKPDRFGKTVREVIYAPSQFSGVNSPEWNKAYNQKFVNKEEESIYKQMLQISYQALNGKLKDTTGGADHYVNLELAQPSWSKVYKKTIKVGKHTYFKEVYK